MGFGSPAEGKNKKQYIQTNCRIIWHSGTEIIRNVE